MVRLRKELTEKGMERERKDLKCKMRCLSAFNYKCPFSECLYFRDKNVKGELSSGKTRGIEQVGRA